MPLPNCAAWLPRTATCESVTQPFGNAQEIALDTATEHALRADELRGALATAEAERDQLARWKSTNAPRQALDGLLADARAEAAKGAEAISSLASEREANAILTAENDQLRAQVERLRGGEPVTLTDEEIEELQWRVPAARNSTADDLQIRTTRQMTLFARAIEAALREKGNSDESPKRLHALPSPQAHRARHH